MKRLPEYERMLELLGVDDSFVAELYEMPVDSCSSNRRIQIDFVHKARLFKKLFDGQHELSKPDRRNVIPGPKQVEEMKPVQERNVVRGLKNL